MGELPETSFPAGYLKAELLKNGDGMDTLVSHLDAEQLKDSFLTL